jgi:hypothetical protein
LLPEASSLPSKPAAGTTTVMLPTSIVRPSELRTVSSRVLLLDDVLVEVLDVSVDVGVDVDGVRLEAFLLGYLIKRGQLGFGVC